MSLSGNEIYKFGPFRLDAENHLLLRDGQPVPLTPKAFDTLLTLVRSHGRLVSKDDLMKQVWPDTFVEESSLTRNISVLRKLLGSGADGDEFIETVPKLGYRFRGQVQALTGMQHAVVVERHVESRIVRDEFEERSTSGLGSPAVLFWAAAGLLAVVGITAGVMAWRKDSQPVKALRVLPFASYAGTMQAPSFAPDGQRLAFAWTGPAQENLDIYVKTVGNDPPLRLTSDPDHDRCPAWSPDGRQVAFLRGNDGLMAIFVVGALGGAERKLIDVARSRYFDLDWSPDGRFIAFAEKTNPSEVWGSLKTLAVFLFNVQTREKRQLTFPDRQEGDSRFTFSPDGRTLAFVRHHGDEAFIMHVPLEGGAPVRVHQEASWVGHLAWTADSRELIFTSEREGGSKLFRIPAGGGSPQPLPFGEDSAYNPAVSPQGDRMAYLRHSSDDDLWQVELQGPRGPAKPPRIFLGTSRRETSPEFSPDGAHITFFSEGTGRSEVWMANADGTNPLALTDFHASTTYAPGWSPDGMELVFASTHGPDGSRGGVFALDVNTRSIRRLTDDAYFLPWWSRDARWIYLAPSRYRSTTSILKIPAAGGAAFPVAPGGGDFAQESLDGTTLYYMKHTGGIWKISPGKEEETLVVPGFSGKVRGFWRVMQDGIFYLQARDHAPSTIEFFDFATRRSHPIAVLPGKYTEFNGGLTVSPDRRRIVYSQVSREVSEIMLVENFR